MVTSSTRNRRALTLFVRLTIERPSDATGGRLHTVRVHADVSGVDLHARASAPRPVMADASRYAELAVVGSRGHAPLAGALLGSVSQHLLHHPRCPVAVVRERA